MCMVCGISYRSVSFFCSKPDRCGVSIKPYGTVCDALLGRPGKQKIMQMCKFWKEICTILVCGLHFFENIVEF